MVLGFVWHWITSWWPIMLSYGVAGLWTAGLVAAAVLIPWMSFKVRMALIAVAGLILLTTASFTVGIKKGADRVQDDWDWQLELEAQQGEQVRTDASDTVRNAEPDSSVRNGSPWNRDTWQKPKDD